MGKNKGRTEQVPSREELEALREIARRAIEAGKDTAKKVQQERIQRIDDVLDAMDGI